MRGSAVCFRGKYAEQTREGEFFAVRPEEGGLRTILKKGKIHFGETGETWEGDFIDFRWNEGHETCTFKLVGIMTKKEGEKEKSGVWKCRDTGETYEVVEYLCDLETWEKGKGN